MKLHTVFSIMFTLAVFVVQAKEIHYPQKNLSFGTVKNVLIDGAFDVVVVLGDQPSLSIEAPDEIVSNILIDQQGEDLIIRNPHHINFEDQNIVLRLTLSELSNLQLREIKSFESLHPLWFDQLSITIDTHHKTRFKLMGKQVYISNHGAGDVEISGVVNQATINQNGLGAFITKGLNAGTITFKSGKDSKPLWRVTQNEVYQTVDAIYANPITRS